MTSISLWILNVHCIRNKIKFLFSWLKGSFRAWWDVVLVLVVLKGGHTRYWETMWLLRRDPCAIWRDVPCYGKVIFQWKLNGVISKASNIDWANSMFHFIFIPICILNIKWKVLNLYRIVYIYNLSQLNCWTSRTASLVKFTINTHMPKMLLDCTLRTHEHTYILTHPHTHTLTHIHTNTHITQVKIDINWLNQYLGYAPMGDSDWTPEHTPCHNVAHLLKELQRNIKMLSKQTKNNTNEKQQQRKTMNRNNMNMFKTGKTPLISPPRTWTKVPWRQLALTDEKGLS